MNKIAAELHCQMLSFKVNGAANNLLKITYN